MSSAHRPTWNPAEGRADERHKSARVAARHMPSHTKLKFRQPQQGGQASALASRSEIARQGLKSELEAAERESRNKKRKEQGLAPEEEEAPSSLANGEGESKLIEGSEQDEERVRRKKLLEEAMRLEKEGDNSDDESVGSKSKGKGKEKENEASSVSESDSSDDDDDDDDEDDTAALLRELEKIKRERAEEKARQERERAEVEQSNREDEIALGNPLLNLENAMRGSGSAQGKMNGTASFGVKRRWDDDVIFKNQAMVNDKEREGFVNDLTRSEFHKRFLQRFIR